MARMMSRLSASAAFAAALSLAAAPVSAAPLPAVSAPSPLAASTAWSPATGLEDADSNWRRRYRGYRHHRYRDRGLDAGDVLAGVLILGGIAAVASAASNSSKRNDDYRYREPYPDDPRPEYRPERNYSGSSYTGNGMSNAVDMCVGQVERGNDRVASVNNAARTGDGWRISGELDAGGGFSCWIDNDGRIRNVDLGASYYGSSYNGEGASYPGSAPDNQYDDATYARARAQAGPGSSYGEGEPYGDPYAGVSYAGVDGNLGG